MKKWYRIGICLVLAICLLMLPACRTGDSAQATGEGASQQNNESTNQVTETVALNWTEKYISLSGWPLWEDDAPKIAKALDYESYKALMDECVSRHGACTFDCYLYSEDDGLCPYGRTIRNVPYTKGVLTCSMDIPYSKEVFSTADMASWFCFIAVDTVLPPETEVVLDLGAVEYDYETYKQKDDQFHEKCSP